MPTTLPHRTCPICLEDLNGDANVVALPCGHFLHATCGIEYFRRVPDNRCLECRASPPAETTDEEDSCFEAEWKYWTSVRNREARRNGDVRQLREEYWSARKWYEKEKKRLRQETMRVQQAALSMGISEERFDNAVIASLRERRSRVLSRGDDQQDRR